MEKQSGYQNCWFLISSSNGGSRQQYTSIIPKNTLNPGKHFNILSLNRGYGIEFRVLDGTVHLCQRSSLAFILLGTDIPITTAGGKKMAQMYFPTEAPQPIRKATPKPPGPLWNGKLQETDGTPHVGTSTFYEWSLILPHLEELSPPPQSPHSIPPVSKHPCPSGATFLKVQGLL